MPVPFGDVHGAVGGGHDAGRIVESRIRGGTVVRRAGGTCAGEVRDVRRYQVAGEDCGDWRYVRCEQSEQDEATQKPQEQKR